MIYIIGHQFTYGKPTQQLKGGSILEQREQRKVKSEYFMVNHSYKLINIRKNKEKKIDYTFVDTQTNEMKNITFESTQDADAFIAKASGQLDSFYSLKQKIQNDF